MQPTAGALARDQATGAGTLGRSVAAPYPHRLALAEPPAQRPGPGPDGADRGDRGGRPPDRLRPGLRRLARVLGRAPDPGGAVPRPGRVREPPGHRGPDRGGHRRPPGLRLPLPAPARPDLAERRAGGRRGGPGGPGRDRRLHEAQPLSRHGALLRHHAPAGRRRRPGPPLDPRLRPGLGPSAGAPPADPPLLRRPGASWPW